MPFLYTAGEIPSAESLGELNTYIPALTVASGTNPNLGADGSASGYWHRIGPRWVMGSAWFFASGTGEASGSGRLRVSLPLPADTTLTGSSATAGAAGSFGSGFFRHTTSANSRVLDVQPDQATTVRMFYTAGNNSLDGTDLGTGWRIHIFFSYPIPAGA